MPNKCPRKWGQNYFSLTPFSQKNNSDPIFFNVIFITCANNKEAERIARALVKNKLVACVNIVDKIKSLFWWQGKVEEAEETLLVVKSKQTKLTKIVKLVRSLHSYDVPEIIALPIIGGYKPYLKWIDASVSRLV